MVCPYDGIQHSCEKTGGLFIQFWSYLQGRGSEKQTVWCATYCVRKETKGKNKDAFAFFLNAMEGLVTLITKINSLGSGGGELDRDGNKICIFLYNFLLWDPVSVFYN